ncbi:MAG: thiol reductant ABC exporter subunit CydD [Parvularculaceae bacterium]
MLSKPHEIKESQAKAALKRWASGAISAIRAGIALELAATVGWVLIAFGVGAAAGNITRSVSPAAPLALTALGAVLRAASTWAAETVLARAGRKMIAAARKEIFYASSRAGASFLGGAPSGARAAQIMDRTKKLAGYASRWKPGIAMALAGPLVILVATATQSWLASAILFVTVSVLPLFIWLTASETAARGRAQQDALDHLAGAFQARAAQSGIIRAFRAVRRERAEIEHASADLRERTMAILRMAFLSTAVMEFFASVSIALVAVYIGFKLLGVFPFETGETLTLASGLTALLLAPEFFAPIRKLSTLHHDRADASAAARMLAPWIESAKGAAPVRLATLRRPPTIDFKSATLAHPDGSEICNVNFKAQPGGVTVLTGPSGSGKTTCLLALIGRTSVAAGTIEINGAPMSANASLADSIAFVGQTPWLGEGTIEENIALAAPGASPRETKAAAQTAGVMRFADEPRGGLQQHLARHGAGLSGGQRLRIAMARTILRNAPILLLDEPTAHLDPDAEAEFIDLLKSLAKEKTVVIATHSPALIANADNIVTLQPERIEASPC